MNRKNVGALDAYLRITAGFLGLTYGISRIARRPHRAPWLLMTMSAMNVASGVTRFCPINYAMGINTGDIRFKPGIFQKQTDQPFTRDKEQLQPQHTGENKRTETGDANVAVSGRNQGKPVHKTVKREAKKYGHTDKEVQEDPIYPMYY